MKYQTMYADNRIVHESDRNLLPEGATIIKSVYESTYEQVSYIVQHDYEMIIYKDKNGKKMISIKEIISKALKVDILKVFSLNAIATLVRMLCGAISVKVIALLIGPVGIALLGQLTNFRSIVLGLANGGIQSGITKYVAEYKEDGATVKKYISNALYITVICSIVVGIILIVGSYPLSKLILRSGDYSYVLIIFGFTLLLYTLNTFLISVLNGYKQFRLYVKVNIIGTVFGLIYSVALIYYWNLPGAMINVVTYQSVVFFITLYLCRNVPWMSLSYFKEKLSPQIVKRFLGYSLMTITSLAVLPVSQLLLRGYVISELSPTDAGIWEGMNRISSMYLSLITSSFAIYYLPRLSEINDNKELHNEIFRCYKFIIPILLGVSFIIFNLKHFILWLLFTPEFNPMEDLFGWQLAGDFFKMCSWLLSYLMLAKAKVKMFIFTEIAFAFSYVLLAFSFLKLNGIVGLTQGYLVNYILYTIVMALLFRKVIFIKKWKPRYRI